MMSDRVLVDSATGSREKYRCGWGGAQRNADSDRCWSKMVEEQGDDGSREGGRFQEWMGWDGMECLVGWLVG